MVRHISNGVFGKVYAGCFRGHQVAIKVQDKSLTDTVARHCQKRELLILRTLRSFNFEGSDSRPHVIGLVAWDENPFQLILVLELCVTDLRTYIIHDADSQVTSDDAQRFASHICNGLKHLREKCIVHRDLKTQNVLLRRLVEGQPLAALIADFGWSRFYNESDCRPEVEAGEPGTMTRDLVTLWYRAPEILVAHNRYGFAVDVWSAGCILVEMEQGLPPFQERSEIGMLFKIFSICGTPSDCEWQSLRASGDVQAVGYRGRFGNQIFGKFRRRQTPPWGDAYGESMRDLASSILRVDPAKRMSASDALLHPWMLCKPLAATQ